VEGKKICELTKKGNSKPEEKGRKKKSQKSLRKNFLMVND
jgi:hypothetical protein